MNRRKTSVTLAFASREGLPYHMPAKVFEQCMGHFENLHIPIYSAWESFLRPGFEELEIGIRQDCALQQYKPNIFPTLPYPSLPYPTLSYPTLPYPTLPYPPLPSATLPSPPLPSPTLPCSTLPYPTPILCYRSLL